MQKQTTKAKKTLVSAPEPAEFEKIPILTSTLGSSTNWKERVDIIETLMNICVTQSEALKSSTKFIVVADSISKALNDTNIKVSIKCVEALEKFVPLFKTNIEQNILPLLTALVNNLSSTNVTLKNKADILIDLLVDTVENSCLIQHFSHFSLFGSPRAKPIIIAHLCGILTNLTILDIIPEVYKAKPALIIKHVYPAAFKLLDDTKNEMKSAVNKLIQTLYGCAGSSLLEAVPQNKIQRVLETVKL